MAWNLVWTMAWNLSDYRFAGLDNGLVCLKKSFWSGQWPGSCLFIEVTLLVWAMAWILSVYRGHFVGLDNGLDLVCL